jgi:hypothetical protein
LALAESAQIRALTRLWTVDESDFRVAPAVIRRGILAVLRSVHPGKWYDANDVARLAVVETGTSLTPVQATPESTNSRIDRSTVDRALVELGVIGTISLALDDRGRPTALRLTDAGVEGIR